MNSTNKNREQESTPVSLELELRSLSDWVLANYPRDGQLNLLGVCLFCLADKARRLEVAVTSPPDRPLPRALQAGVGKDGAPYIQHFDPDC